MEGLSKKKKGLTDTDDSVVVARGGGIKGLNGNGKNTIKNSLYQIFYFANFLPLSEKTKRAQAL